MDGRSPVVVGIDPESEWYPRSSPPRSPSARDREASAWLGKISETGATRRGYFDFASSLRAKPLDGRSIEKWQSAKNLP